MSEQEESRFSPLAQIRQICAVPPNIFGVDYLEHLARRTGEILGLDYVLIGASSLKGSCVNEEGRVDVVVPMLDGKRAESFSYSLKDTPCLEVLSNERVCSFFGDVQARFPKDLDLVELKATSYVGAPILGPDGELKGIFAVLNREPMNREQDLVGVVEFLGARAGIEFHRLEQLKELSERSQEELQQKKFQSLGRLAGGIAHDFNNILSSIMGHAEILALRPSDRSRETIIQAAVQGKELTRQLLDFARPGGRQTEGSGELNEVVRDTCKLLERGTHRQLSFNIQSNAEAAWVSVSPSSLQQIVMNLILNARDAQPESAVVSIRVSKETSEKGEPLVILEVQDQGEGIASEDLPKIFEPFFTTKSAIRGTGLGLATVYGLVHAHKGDISVLSTIGGGTTMRVCLPEGTQENIADAAENMSIEEVGTNRRWLVIEDESSIREVLETLLDMSGIQAFCAANTKDAHRLLQEQTSGFDGVISDLNLSGEGALSFLKTYRASHPMTPIVIITGDPTTADAIDVRQLPGTTLISKPFRASELMGLVSHFSN